MTTFECGFNWKGRYEVSTKSKFFIVGLLFLIFDIEFSLFLPLIFESMNVGVVVSVVFFAILMNVSLIHELNESTLEWF